MNRTLQFKVDWLKLVFWGQALANVWDNAASSPITQLFVSLHTGDPGPGNDQTVNECTYGGYGRIATNRNSGAWAIDGATAIVTPTATILMNTPTSGTGTITHVGIGKSTSGVGYLFYSGALSPNLIITIGTPPQLTTSSKITATS